MNDEKWGQLIGNIKDSFEVVSHETVDGDYEGEKIEELIFNNDAGKMKLIRSVKPRVVGEKSHFSNRKGATGEIEKVYSDTETVDVVELFVESGVDWREIDVSSLG